ncbi:MAG: 16S rRNA (cytosine(967)-C(5))-methyltransferase RsmB [Firmicutes bacterium]|nr:16S rRNA (cytosine(967)-C(5))-methyltransferase RsmB [Bacillota bacterium]
MDINRKTAYYILEDIEKDGAYSNLAINNRERQMKPSSPAFVRELVYGVLRYQMRLDYIASQLMERKGRLKRSDKILLRMGLYQLIYMDSVPDYAAVSETVRLAKVFCRGRDSFINGILRAYGRRKDEIVWPDRRKDPVDFLSSGYSCDPWIVRLWLSQYGEERTEEMLAAANDTPRLCIRVNRLKATPEQLRERLEREGFALSPMETVEEGFFAAGSGLVASAAYEEGWFSIQDESSMRAVLAVDPQPGETVIDVCAAPGGKTLFMAERMENRGTILAGDLYPARLTLLEEQAKRLGVTAVRSRAWDASRVQEELVDRADRVLVDAPCSGLGVIRRKPEIKYREEETSRQRLPQIQREILEASCRYVKAGGVLVYSTCTINEEENSQVAGAFLQKHPEFEVVEEQQMYLGRQEGDGFYICKMKRKQPC